jgi:hypothetical protein
MATTANGKPRIDRRTSPVIEDSPSPSEISHRKDRQNRPQTSQSDGRHRSRRLLVVSAYGAFLLALLFALVSFYWAVGGKWGLDTLGGSLEKFAKSASPGAMAVIWAVVALKLIAAALALAFVRPRGRRIPSRYLVTVGTLAGATVTIYGAMLVATEALVETGAVRPASSVDWLALRWHLELWDMWFLIYGILLLVTVSSYRRYHSPAGSRRWSL